MLRKGGSTTRRIHAKNYIQKQADARLKEVVTAYQRQGLNALGVDFFTALYYYTTTSTNVCTCKQVEASVANVYIQDTNILGKEVNIDYTRPLFGYPNDSQTSNDETSLDEFSIDDEEAQSINSLFSSSNDCGLCYRSGYIPAHDLYGHVRYLFSTHNIINAEGYNIDKTQGPHVIRQIDPNGFVTFGCDIPKYFNKVRYSIRNNNTILEDYLLYQQRPLVETDLRTKFIEFQITSLEFTHVILEFEVGSDPVLVNLAQYSKTQDWTIFETLGNLNIILPMTIQEVKASDIVYIPSRGVTLKVTDLPYLRTSDDRNLDWSVNCRVLQPQEPVRYIGKHFPLSKT